MSQLRVYVNGRPDWTDLGPGRARVAGYGGALVTHSITVTNRPRVRRPERSPLVYAGPRCGIVMRSGIPCGRRAGHADAHRSPEAVLRDSARRRATR